MVKYPEIVVQLDLEGPGGNVFSVLGKVLKALKRAGVLKEERDIFVTEATSGNYEHALEVVERWVGVV